MSGSAWVGELVDVDVKKIRAPRHVEHKLHARTQSAGGRTEVDFRDAELVALHRVLH